MAKKIQLTMDFEAPQEKLEKAISQQVPGFIDYRVLSKSLDARGANQGKRPRYQYSLEVILPGENFTVYQEELPNMKEKFLHESGGSLPLIIGAGPAGLFCALRLMEYGIPSIIFERGSRANERMKHIARFWRYGEFNPEDNVCFGEGGAGLFSDGKLITRVKSPFVGYVMKKFVDFGAPEETAYVSNPHLGSNKIRSLITELTNFLTAGGCQIHYNTKVEKLLLSEKNHQEIVGLMTSDHKEFYSPQVILAVGHSAKEMFHHLHQYQVSLKPKDFAIGVRVEHPRKEIDQFQYGSFVSDELSSARYRLSYHDNDTHKGTYSFCMCPGGYVLSSGTDSDGIVVNGMSNYRRNSPWSNSALVVSVKSGVDFDAQDILAGHQFQRGIEKKAYDFSKERASGKEIPAEKVTSFLKDGFKSDLPKTSCPSKIFPMPLEEILPGFIHSHLQTALENFDRKLKGFISPNALLMAPETRTSSPLTIERDKNTLESTSHKGLFPCGEGAGYAGGITSAAVDGVRVAESIIVQFKDK